MVKLPIGQCARSMPLRFWLRPSALKHPKRLREGTGRRRCRAQRVIRRRNDPRMLWPRSREFEQRHRLTPEMVEYLAGEFFRSSIYITQGDDPNGRGSPIPVFQKVCLALRFMATGANYTALRDTQGGCSKGALSDAVHRFVKFLCSRSKNYITFPSGYELHESAVRFANNYRFNQCVGCIDGSYVPIKRPTNQEANYICRHGYHALNVMLVTDARQRFTFVESAVAGSHHDMSVFDISDFGQLVSNTDRMGDYFLLADSGYALTERLMTPFKNVDIDTMEPWDKRYQSRHTSARSSVERAIGQLKTRWRCLAKNGGGVVKMEPLQASRLVRACCVLHNMCVDWGLRAVRPQDRYDPDIEGQIQKTAAKRFLKALRDARGRDPVVHPRRRFDKDAHLAGVARRKKIIYQECGGPSPVELARAQAQAKKAKAKERARARGRGRGRGRPRGPAKGPESNKD